MARRGACGVRPFKRQSRRIFLRRLDCADSGPAWSDKQGGWKGKLGEGDGGILMSEGPKGFVAREWATLEGRTSGLVRRKVRDFFQEGLRGAEPC